MKTISNVDEETLSNLKNKIERLDKSKHIELFGRLQKKNVMYTENRNGIFINMNDIPSEIVKDMIHYTEYLETQDDIMNSLEKKKHSIELTLNK